MPKPLDKFPIIRTSNAEDMNDAITRLYGDVRFHSSENFAGLWAHGNHCQLNDIGISYASYGAAIDHFYANPPHVYAVPMAFAGSAWAKTANTSTELSRRRTLISSPGLPFEMRARRGFEEITVQLDALAVRRTLTGLIGADVNSELLFDPILDFENPVNLLWRRLLQFLIDEVGSCDGDLPLAALGEIEQALIGMFINANNHSLSHLLNRRPRNAAPRQVRLAEEYIESRWDQPVSVELLAQQTNVSARSLFNSFRKSRGYSPMAFVKQVRLRHARQMLLCAEPGTTVAKVASACGFGNLGNFAKDYRNAFGELPSNTLKMSPNVIP